MNMARQCCGDAVLASSWLYYRHSGRCFVSFVEHLFYGLHVSFFINSHKSTTKKPSICCAVVQSIHTHRALRVQILCKLMFHFLCVQVATVTASQEPCKLRSSMFLCYASELLLFALFVHSIIEFCKMVFQWTVATSFRIFLAYYSPKLRNYTQEMRIIGLPKSVFLYMFSIRLRRMGLCTYCKREVWLKTKSKPIPYFCSSIFWVYLVPLNLFTKKIWIMSKADLVVRIMSFQFVFWCAALAQFSCL